MSDDLAAIHARWTLDRDPPGPDIAYEDIHALLTALEREKELTGELTQQCQALRAELEAARAVVEGTRTALADWDERSRLDFGPLRALIAAYDARKQQPVEAMEPRQIAAYINALGERGDGAEKGQADAGLPPDN